MPFDEIVPPLAGLGFRKRGDGVFTTELGPEISGWIGLNRATQHRSRGEFEVFPVVGVRFETVERILDELLDSRGEKYVTASLSSPLRYLLPVEQRRTWIVSPDTATEIAEEIAGAIASYGMPFVRSIASMKALRSDDVGTLTSQDQLRYRLPIAVALSGDPAEANTMVDRSLCELEGKPGPLAEHFRAFANRFKEKFS